MKLTKKILAVVLSVLFVVGVFAGCSANNADDKGEKTKSSATSDMKVGFIFLHDENSTYDKNFITAADEACKTLGIADENKIYKTNVPEGQECAEAAEDLVDKGCSIIFADSFGHEPYIIEVAKKYPDVQFCHSTGTRAHTEGVSNYHNAFASIYEGRYLAGVAAGMKLNQMIENGEFDAKDAKIGYVGAYTYAEVISGYTSFFLGARSVCPSATMEVQFTGSWYDEAAEKEAANTLIANGCKLISQHADSMGAPTACENAGVPDVSYNGSTVSACPNTFIVSSRINWAPYYEYAIKAVMDGKKIDADWTGTLATNSVLLTDVNEKAAAPGTQKAIDEAKAKLEDGSLQVFDTSTFTVGGEEVTTAPVDLSFMDYTTDPATVVYQGETVEAIEDGHFAESTFRSAPYFTLRIDGITEGADAVE